MKQFSFDTIEDFDKHIQLSVPGYDDLINHIFSLSTFFIKENSLVYDFGCSTGRLLDILRQKYPKSTFVGVDKAENLTRGKDYIINADLRDFIPQKHSFSTLIFTLQFLPLETRKTLLKRICEKLEGALIVAEKTLINNGFLQDTFTFSYYDFKLKSFTLEEIISKQIDLRGMMRPLSATENIQLFYDAGFRTIETFWQSLNFKAWILY